MTRSRPSAVVGHACAALCVLVVSGGPAVLPAQERAPAVTAGRDFIARDIIVKQGLSQEEAVALVAGALRALREEEGRLGDKRAELARALGVTESATRNFFRILGREGVEPEKLLDTLAEIAERHVALLEQARAATSEDAAIGALRERATAAIEGGEYERAEALLGDIRERRLVLARARQAEAEEEFLRVAATSAELGGLSEARLRLNC